MATLIYKLRIDGKIEVKTGLHIGGSDSDLDIGGIDNSIIKTKGGIPYIPGSSLKGKLRDLIARSKGYTDIKEDKDETLKLFAGNEIDKCYSNGNPMFDNGRKIKIKIPTRLIVRDCFVYNDQVEIEEKAENTINRATGEAMPRHIERVSPESVFEMEMILDIYDVDKIRVLELLKTLKLGFDLLEQDYLGGSGSRGYGKIEFHDFSILPVWQAETPAADVLGFIFQS